MYLKHIQLHQFKNYQELSLDFCETLNCFVGPNGSGKTNVLEAIHYMSFCKGFVNSSDAVNVQHEQEYFAVHAEICKESIPDKLSCVVKLHQKKTFKLNSKEYDRLADHIGAYPMVLISPSDNNLIQHGSEERRKYFDSVISQFDTAYLNDLISYNKALLQRNILLKSFAEKHYFDAASLEIWDEQLLRFGLPIFEKRKQFVMQYAADFNHYYQLISRGNEQVGLIYHTALDEMEFSTLLQESLGKDRKSQYTQTGIHKDDFEFVINGFPLRKYGSQGQQKSYSIALKLAQFEITRKKKGFPPLLLLDDIFDKLDEDRVSELMRIVGGKDFGQVFITDTHQQRMQELFVKNGLQHRIYLVNSGVASEIES